MSNYTDFVKRNCITESNYVEYGYGQVEPNHLSAQRNGQIYAQLPADKDIQILENGKFLKYDYAKGVANCDGPGEWMLVFNEIKLYRDGQQDCEFAMIKDNYNARVYSPSQGGVKMTKQSRNYSGKDTLTEAEKEYFSATEKVTLGNDPYELFYNEDPFHIYDRMEAQMMPEGTTMVPRLFKTMVGDIYTTNMINVDTGDKEPGDDGYEATLAAAILAQVKKGNFLTPGKDGVLIYTEEEKIEDAEMVWQIVKVYTMPDGQNGVKIMRIK